MYGFSKLSTAHLFIHFFNSLLYDDVEKERGHTLDLVPYCLKQELRRKSGETETTHDTSSCGSRGWVLPFFF